MKFAILVYVLISRLAVLDAALCEFVVVTVMIN
jgi:hypothetical protein